MTARVPSDAAALAASVGAALRAAGLPAGTGRCERLARALTVLRASTVADVHACALATMVSDPSQLDTFERVFADLFGTDGPVRPPDPAGPALMDAEPGDAYPPPGSGQESAAASPVSVPGFAPASGREPDITNDDGDSRSVNRIASAAERLASRDFAGLSDDELRELAALMRELVVSVPPRSTRRYAPSRGGKRPDLRRTLRLARRTGGEPVRLAHRTTRTRPRRLVVLCDISGSMEPYARALLQLMYCASRGAAGPGGRARTEVFTFATRLTRLTRALTAASPQTLLAKAAQAAPDWSGGTRIGVALKEFNDRYGARGMARGAVVLIISDGWETGDPVLLGGQMARLSRIAYRIVWANPRTQSPRYRPEVGGMAAAWPYCDAVVSAHSLNALDELLSALAS
jgi:uncharacterized protein